MRRGHGPGPLLRALGPRRLRAARTTLAGVVSAACAVNTAAALLRPEGPTALDLGGAAVLLVVVAGLLLLPDGPAAALCVLTHLLGIALVAALDLLTRDATVAAQVFFCLPVISAGTLLRVPGVVLVTAAAVGAEAVVVLHVLPAEQAWIDLVFVGTALVLAAAALARSGVLQDRLVAQLQRQAALDALTGLATRRALDAAIAGALASASRGTGPGTSLLLVDVDRFKRVNDVHGHVAGDQALVHVAGVLRAGSRAGDVVARMGGDELAVLLPGCTYPTALDRALDLVEAVRAAPLRLRDGTVVALSISVGAAHVPDHATTADALYARADEALYAAKRAGRDRTGQVAAGDRVAAG